MKTTDIKVCMVFSHRDLLGYTFEVDRIQDDRAYGREFKCGRTLSGSAEGFPLAQLADEKVWRLLEGDTIDGMAGHIEILQERLDSFRQQSNEDWRRLRTDMKRVQTYVDDARRGEYGYSDPEGNLCLTLLEKWTGASSPGVPPAYPGANHGHSKEAVQTALAAPGLSEGAKRAEEGLRALSASLEAGESPPGTRKDPLAELSSVLWFLASLTCDHEPLCGIKAMGPCDCEKLIPDNDPWHARVRNALHVAARLGIAQTKAAILSCNGCGDPLKQGEMMVCKQCAQIVHLKGNRRVVQIHPIAGKPGPNGDGTVYEVAIPEKISRLVVLRRERASVTPEQMIALRKGFEKLFRGTVGLLPIEPGEELVFLELPR